MPAAEVNESNSEFLQLAINALSDAFLYPAPVLLELKEFNEVKATVLQVARAPGQFLVYLGCLFLVIGVFAMLYIKERRVWFWLEQTDDSTSVGTKITYAMSSTRQTLEFDEAFRGMKHDLRMSFGS